MSLGGSISLVAAYDYNDEIDEEREINDESKYTLSLVYSSLLRGVHSQKHLFH